MFEFGKDLRRLFAQARESDDLGWVELIGVDLLAGEARAQAIDAGRVSCARPFETALRAAALWREHARRTGAPHSLDEAERALRSARRVARNEAEFARLEVEKALQYLLVFDLRGTLAGLRAAERTLEAMDLTHRRRAGSLFALAHARIRGRLVLLASEPEGIMDAAALMDAALHEAGSGDEADALRLDRAALILEAGLTGRDVRLLDQAGRSLRELVEASPEDYRPLTRARALILCAAGLCALANLAGDAVVAAQGRALFAAASDLFTPDHSPLDWVAVQLAAAGHGTTSLSALIQAEALSSSEGLALGAMALETRAALEIETCARLGDRLGLTAIETRLLEQVRTTDARVRPLVWAACQIALGRIRQVRAHVFGDEDPQILMLLTEAELTAWEHGARGLALRARACRDTAWAG